MPKKQGPAKKRNSNSKTNHNHVNKAVNLHAALEYFSPPGFRQKKASHHARRSTGIAPSTLALRYLLALIPIVLIIIGVVTVTRNNAAVESEETSEAISYAENGESAEAKVAEIDAESDSQNYYRLLGDTELTDEKGDYISLLNSGCMLSVLSNNGNELQVSTASGDTGYIQAREDADGITPIQDYVSIFDPCFENLSLDEKLKAFEYFFPDGAYWNHLGIDISGMSQDEACMITTEEECAHSANGYVWCNEYDGETLYYFDYDNNVQCLGFASMMSDFLFGADAPINIFYDFDELRVGDHIRITYYEHSMLVVSVGDGYVEVAECNSDYENCRISWGRRVTEDELYYEYGGGIEYISRYSDFSEEIDYAD